PEPDSAATRGECDSARHRSAYRYGESYDSCLARAGMPVSAGSRYRSGFVKRIEGAWLGDRALRYEGAPGTALWGATEFRVDRRQWPLGQRTPSAVRSDNNMKLRVLIIDDEPVAR